MSFIINFTNKELRMMGELRPETNEEIINGGAENLGRITVLEALAEETIAVSPDALGRTTMQMQVDFDD